MLSAEAMSSDDALLDAWAGGDDAAGGELYERYADRIVEFFSRKTDRDAADLVQRTFLKCLEARKRGSEVRNVRAFLYTIARNELYDRFKSRDRFDPMVTSLHDLGPSPTGALARHEEERLLLAGLQRIPLDHQIALELYYWEQLPMAEVAEILGVKRSAAISRVHRARGLLRDAMDALERDAALVELTMTNFERWAEELRER